MRKTKSIRKTFMAFALCVLALGTGIFSSSMKPFQTMAETSVVGLKESKIEDDLSDLGDLSVEYPINKDGSPTLVRMQEYCYTDYAAFMGNYGVYLYVYNPSGKEVLGTRCTVNMAVNYIMGSPYEYANVGLRLLDNTNDWTLLKFKVSDEAELYNMAKTYAGTQGGVRRYDIAGLQLYYKDGGVLDDNGVSKTYIWTGYAAGMNNNAESSLSCDVDTLETLSLDVKHTYYRVHSNEIAYKTDMLHSVYFSVPNEYLERYGALYRIHAEYLGARLKPALVLGDEGIYNEVAKYLWEDMSTHNEALNYEIAAHLRADGYTIDDFAADYVFNYAEGVDIWPYGDRWIDNVAWYTLNNYSENGKGDYLYLLFDTDGFGENKADSYKVPAECIKEQMKKSALNSKSSGSVVGVEGEYSKDIFSSIDNTKKQIILTADDTFDLTQTIYKQEGFLDWLFGLEGTAQIKYIFKDRPVIHQVSEEDFIYDDNVNSERLLIGAEDYNDFKQAYNVATENNETLFLFHYRVSEYEAYEANILEERDPAIGAELFQLVSTNGYFFEQDVDLSFDIIDVMFLAEDGVETVIGVVSKPTDAVAGSEPPSNTTRDEPKTFWGKVKNFFLNEDGTMKWYTKVIIGVIVWMLLSAIGKAAYPRIPFLLAGVPGAFYLITLPFRFIIWLIRLIIDKIKERRKGKGGDKDG